jgi:hypothetical protein
LVYCSSMIYRCKSWCISSVDQRHLHGVKSTNLTGLWSLQFSHRGSPRLGYRLQQGTGPREGWVTVRLAGGKVPWTIARWICPNSGTTKFQTESYVFLLKLLLRGILYGWFCELITGRNCFFEAS